MIEFDFSAIRNAVVKMLTVNMGLKAGERVLFLSDVPTMNDWYAGQDFITDFSMRTLTTRAACEIAKEEFPDNTVDLYLYPSCNGHGVEIPADAAAKVLEYDVIIAITTWSISHTDARSAASAKGIRIASCGNLELNMLMPDNVIDADYQQIAAKACHIADLLTPAKEVRLVTEAGTELSFSIEGRKGLADTGFYNTPGAWGNLPGGEAYTAPVEGTANGTLVVLPHWAYGLDERMEFTIQDGCIIKIDGGGKYGDDLREHLLGAGSPHHRCNVAELGIGTNYRASKPDNVLETEKIDGTVHIGFGDNAHFGGTVSSDYHDDMVVPEPDLYLDGQLVIQRGKLLR